MTHPVQTRREFLKLAGALTAGPALTAAGQWFQSTPPPVDNRHDFVLARVKFACDSRVPDQWNISPGGDWNLLTALKEVIRCKPRFPHSPSDYDPYYGQDEHFSAVTDLADASSLKSLPFLFMTAEGGFTLGTDAKNNLKRHIGEGGFLLMDDCVYNGAGDFFYKSAYALLEELFGRGAVKEVPGDHEVFHNVHDIQDPGLPRLHGVNHGARGVFIDNRLAVFLSSTDIHCGWTDRLGRWFGQQGYRSSIELGINIIMYAISH